MKQYIYIGISVLLIIVCGCKSPDYDTKKSKAYPLKDEKVLIVESLSGSKKSESEIQQLVKTAKAGNGKAAFTLASYYDGAGANAKLAKKYHIIAEKLNDPYELFRVAMREWGSNLSPDLNKIEAYARKAAQASIDRADELLAEIVEARSSGSIPDETKLRWVGEP
jgi:hypothetical protein